MAAKAAPGARRKLRKHCTMNQYIEELENRIIKVKLPPFISDEMGDVFLAELGRYLKVASAEQPLFVLTSEDSTARTTTNVRHRFVEVARNPKLGAVAVTESNPFVKVLAMFVLKATQRSETIRFFETEEKGLQWLKEQCK